jgi:hypothetical protein
MNAEYHAAEYFFSTLRLSKVSKVLLVNGGVDLSNYVVIGAREGNNGARRNLAFTLNR